MFVQEDSITYDMVNYDSISIKMLLNEFQRRRQNVQYTKLDFENYLHLFGYVNRLDVWFPDKRKKIMFSHVIFEALRWKMHTLQ